MPCKCEVEWYASPSSWEGLASETDTTLDPDGNVIETVTRQAPEPAPAGSASVVGRDIFYNDSSFDGNDPGASAADDNAIAPDKWALLPGQTATFANYTSYDKGINGIIIVDIKGLPANGTLSASDFSFLIGNSATPSTWAAAPALVSVTVRRGAGVHGSDRVEIIWADGVIKKKWLQVTVLADANTGLASPDVFYFGNAIGDSGNSPTNTLVNGLDQVGVQNFPTTSAPIADPYDYNRDGAVDVSDRNIVSQNPTTVTSALKLITAPGGLRDSYVADYYDAAGRLTAEENVGTDGGLVWTRPASPDPADANHLVDKKGGQKVFPAKNRG